MITPHSRKIAARIGGLALHAYGDSDAIAKRARAGLDARFVREALEIDPTLAGDGLARKVKRIKKLYFTRLAARSAAKRARQKRRS
ncbi:MAG: hypothetical protein WD208_03475 [Dehalococcoidia bacterium]